MDVKDIVAEVLSGKLDDHLSLISDKVRYRREELTSIVAARLRMGDAVKIIGIKPKYMIGATAKIVRVNRTRAVVNLDRDFGRFCGDITVPLACLQKT
jgi:hypothetical protein